VSVDETAIWQNDVAEKGYIVRTLFKETKETLILSLSFLKTIFDGRLNGDSTKWRKTKMRTFLSQRSQ
jgi:hypothetical protein